MRRATPDSSARKLARRYSSCEGDDVLEEYIPLVRRIAYHIAGSLPPTVELEDLIQAGMLGLLNAIKKAPVPSEQPGFKTYASTRIRGSILDFLRNLDPVPRRTREKLHRAEQIIVNLQQALGRMPSDREVSDQMGISLDDYHELLRISECARLSEWDESNPEQPGASPMAGYPEPSRAEPLEAIETMDFRQRLAAAIDALPKRHRVAVTLYYYEGLNLREIGEILGLTDNYISRVLHHAALLLRASTKELAIEAGIKISHDCDVDT